MYRLKSGRLALILVIISLIIFGCTGTTADNLGEVTDSEVTEGGLAVPEVTKIEFMVPEVMEAEIAESIRVSENVGDSYLNSMPMPDFVYLNPVEARHVNDPDNTEEPSKIIYNNICVIHGLTDLAVQHKITKDLREEFDRIKCLGIPPYRGIKTRIRDNSILIYEEINFDLECNFNNIVSIVYKRILGYALPDENGELLSRPKVKDGEENKYDIEYVMDVFPMNFDLRTGEPISLNMLFRDGFDYLELLNEKIQTTLSTGDYDDADDSDSAPFGLTGTYTPIKENQKFYIDDDYSLVLVFDYNTPQFTTRRADNDSDSYWLSYNLGSNQLFDEQYKARALFPTWMRIPLIEINDSLALFQRFMLSDVEQSRLYSDPILRKLIGIDKNKFDRDDFLIEHSDVNGVDVSSRVILLCDLPQELREPVFKLAKNDEWRIKELGKELAKTPESESVQQNVSTFVTVRQMGGFYQAEVSSYLTSEMGIVSQDLRVFIWRTRDFKLMELGDFFREGFDDYKSYPAEKNKIELEEEGFVFITSDELYVDRSFDHHIRYNFKDIGYENLTVFD